MKCACECCQRFIPMYIRGVYFYTHQFFLTPPVETAFSNKNRKMYLIDPPIETALRGYNVVPGTVYREPR